MMLNDPAQRKLSEQDRPSFEREWSAAGKWTLLALPQPIFTNSNYYSDISSVAAMLCQCVLPRTETTGPCNCSTNQRAGRKLQTWANQRVSNHNFDFYYGTALAQLGTSADAQNAFAAGAKLQCGQALSWSRLESLSKRNLSATLKQ